MFSVLVITGQPKQNRALKVCVQIVKYDVSEKALWGVHKRGNFKFTAAVLHIRCALSHGS